VLHCTALHCPILAGCRKGSFADLNVWMANAVSPPVTWGAFSPYPHHSVAGFIDPCNDGIVMKTPFVLRGGTTISGTVLVHEVSRECGNHSVGRRKCGLGIPTLRN
jgi:hypothetical protein